MRTCDDCGSAYDDARCTTICPHEPFLSVDQAERKDRANELLGRDLWFPERAGWRGDAAPPYRIQSIAWDGMVSLAGRPGSYFEPRMFLVKAPT